MLTGTTPYNADTPIAVVLKHVNDPLPPPTSINPEIPDALERILYKALAKSPDDRYQNVEEMAAHLGDLQSAAAIAIPPSVITGTGPAVAPQPLAESASRQGCLGWLMLLVALIALAGGLFTSFSGLLGTLIALPPAMQIASDTPPPTASSMPSPTPRASPTDTPDVQATDVSRTAEAVSTLVLTPSGNATPDLTATVQACDYDYEVLSETPEDGTPYPELTTLTKLIRIVNDSRCPLDDDTRFVYQEGEQLNGPDFVEFNRELQPGDEFEIVLALQTPSYDASTPVVISTWVVQLPSGLQVGPPFTFSLTLYPTGGG
jgi:hypothetical protein